MKKHIITFAVVFALTVIIPIAVCIIYEKTAGGSEALDIFGRSSQALISIVENYC